MGAAGGWHVADLTAATGATHDRVYVGNNDFNQGAGQTATVDASQDAATAAPPAGFLPIQLEHRATIGQDGPPVRLALHPNGTVYAAMERWVTASGSDITLDVVVTRDDNWGNGSFQALVDSNDGQVGQRVATGLFVRFNDVMGQERLGADLTIAVDPNDSNSVWVGWCNRDGGATGTDWTGHVRHSADGGRTWSPDVRTITNIKNPSLAVNSFGHVGLLYQMFTGDRWVTQLEVTRDRWAAPVTPVVLHTAPAATPARTFLPYLGDYVRLLALDADFYGVFCGNNTPDTANFPNGIVYQRNANWNTHTLLAVDGVTPVPVSIDPFFFHRSVRLGLIVYGADAAGNLATVFGSGDMGQGSGALAWLTGDFTGSGKTEIAQPWDNNGRLGLIVYGADASGNLGTVFGSGDMGQGSGALAWLTGDFTGSGKTEIAQPWDNNGRLGLIVYGADASGNLGTVFGSGDMGQGSGALAWLTGDFTGSGKTEIAQPWDNNGRLGLIVYGADASGNLGTVFGSGDMGQGSGALAWLTGDFTGSGKTEIAQPWDNNGRLGLIVYGADASGNLGTVFGSGDMGQGSGALAWLTGDFTGSGKTEIAQPWDNNGRLGLIVYGADASGNLGTVFGSGDMGQGSGALAWLTGDFTGSGKTEIAQPWDNNGRLGLIVYGADASGNLGTVFGSGDMGQGSGALAWLTGDFTGSGKTEIAQPWDNN